MSNTERKPALTPAMVVQCMTPGTSYSLVQIAKLIGTSAPEAQRQLSACVARGTVKESREGKRAAYSLRTEDDILRERERVARNVLQRGVLQGYDATLQRFRELCVASRAPQAGSPNNDSNKESHE